MRTQTIAQDAPPMEPSTDRDFLIARQKGRDAARDKGHTMRPLEIGATVAISSCARCRRAVYAWSDGLYGGPAMNEGCAEANRG